MMKRKKPNINKAIMNARYQTAGVGNLAFNMEIVMKYNSEEISDTRAREIYIETLKNLVDEGADSLIIVDIEQ